MALTGEAVRRGKIYADGWLDGGPADPDALSGTRWVAVRGDIAADLF